MQQFLHSEYFGNSILTYLISIAVIAGSVLFLLLIKKLLISRIRKATQATAGVFDDFIISRIESLALPLLFIAAVYFGISTLYLSPQLDKIIDTAWKFILIYFVIRIITSTIRFILLRSTGTTQDEESKKQHVRILVFIISAIIWITGFIFLIDNLGYDITAIIAGLGIGGIAIALASQAILGDLFSYFVIFFDRPFEEGDFIVVGDKMGSVEHVGIKTTRLRSLSGEQIIFSNTDLTNSRINNYKRMDQRRVEFKLSVEYETPTEELEQIPQLVKEIISSQEKVRFDRGHFSGYGESGLEFTFVFIVLTSEYNFYMDVQQSVFLQIYRIFSDHKINFAYPTQRILLKQSEKK